MADPEQLEILKTRGSEWNNWRRQHQESAINLGGAELRELELFLPNLDRADLSGASLHGADLLTRLREPFSEISTSAPPSD